MSNYNQSRSLNVGLAIETSPEAAFVYDELSFWTAKSKSGWVYKTYDDLVDRFPFLSKYQVRKAVKQLADGGFIETKLKKANGAPTLHFRLLKNLTMDLSKTAQSMDLSKTAQSINSNSPLTQNTKDSDFSFGGVEPHRPPTADTAQATLEKVIEIINPRERANEQKLRMIRGRLKEYTAEEIIDAAHQLSKSEWHRDNKQMLVKNLLAPTKFDRWFDLAQEKKSTAQGYVPPTPEEQAKIDEMNKIEDWNDGDK